MKAQYACLSYCWGRQSEKNHIGQTLCRNIEKYKAGIPVQELPKTIVDAIRLCCKLGFEFLWVDRLCIVQDQDPSEGTNDWEKESSKMCDYYSKSALTISVSICSESSQSFIEEREMGFQEQTEFAIVEYRDEESRSQSSLWFTHYGRIDEGSWFLENDWIHFSERSNRHRLGWLGRGWTFQEWMLSPRVLHINGLTLWDCFHSYANELGQRQMKETGLERSPEQFGKQSGIPWDSIVMEYSKREVTKRTDFLPALAGLAESYRRKTHWTYLYGIWKEEMPISLLWQADHDACDDREVLTDETTPSWSWAHSNSPVYYLFNNFNSKSPEKASVSVPDDFGKEYRPRGSDSTVARTWLDVDGPLSAAKGQRHNFVLGEWREELSAGEEWWGSFPDDDDDYWKQAIDKGEIQLLMLAGPKEDETWRGVYGAIVLRECGREAEGRSVFKRVGLASLELDIGTESTPPGEGPMWEQWSLRIE